MLYGSATIIIEHASSARFREVDLRITYEDRLEYLRLSEHDQNVCKEHENFTLESKSFDGEAPICSGFWSDGLERTVKRNPCNRVG
jgi:hypothetical protein